MALIKFELKKSNSELYFDYLFFNLVNQKKT